jgi:hypothetical protein
VVKRVPAKSSATSLISRLRGINPRYGQHFGAAPGTAAAAAAAAGGGEIVMPTKAEAEPSVVPHGGEVEVASSEQLTEEEEKALQMLGQKHVPAGYREYGGRGGGRGMMGFGGRGGRGGYDGGGGGAAATGGSGGGYGSGFTCKRCGRPGHFAANCPSKIDATITLPTHTCDHGQWWWRSIPHAHTWMMRRTHMHRGRRL